MRLTARILIVSLLAIIVIGWGVHWYSSKPLPPIDIGGLPECGHDAADTIPADIITGIEHVPEFHDCQRFIVKTEAGLEYDSLFAIYASVTLDALTDSLGPPLPDSVGQSVLDSVFNAHGSQPNTAFPSGQFRGHHRVQAAALIAAEGSYAHLGIEPGLSCLYLGRAGSRRPNGGDDWLGRVVKAATDEQARCPIKLWQDVPEGKNLVVKLSGTEEEFTADAEYPAVARWDWSEADSTQYIGIKCGPAWCEVGAEGFTPSPPLSPPDKASREVRRVHLIKGWYDQQLLAKELPDGRLVPSRILGAVVPLPDLGEKELPHFKKRTHVANIVLVAVEDGQEEALESYKMKYNFGETTTDRAIKLRIKAGKTDEEWDGQFRRHWGPFGWFWTDKHRRVIRRPLPSSFAAQGHTVPAVARWRWFQRDEGTWTRCSLGCCEASYY